jgi:putative acetyltransferase
MVVSQSDDAEQPSSPVGECKPMTTIRRLELEDMIAAAGVHRAAFDGRLPWLAGRHTAGEDLGYFQARVFKVCVMWGAFEQGMLVGIIAFREGWIDQLYVLPHAQKRGVGTSLLRIAQANFSELSLWTFQRNQSAYRFYEAHGFAVVDKTDGGANEEREPDVLYRWRRKSN